MKFLNVFCLQLQRQQLPQPPQPPPPPPQQQPPPPPQQLQQQHHLVSKTSGHQSVNISGEQNI